MAITSGYRMSLADANRGIRDEIESLTGAAIAGGVELITADETVNRALAAKAKKDEGKAKGKAAAASADADKDKPADPPAAEPAPANDAAPAQAAADSNSAEPAAPEKAKGKAKAPKAPKAAAEPKAKVNKAAKAAKAAKADKDADKDADKAKDAAEAGDKAKAEPVKEKAQHPYKKLPRVKIEIEVAPETAKTIDWATKKTGKEAGAVIGYAIRKFYLSGDDMAGAE